MTSVRVCAAAGLTAVGLALSPSLVQAAPTAPQAEQAPYGSPRWQQQYEERLRGEVDSEHPTTWMRTLGANAAHVGTPGNRRNLDYAVEQLRGYGLDVDVDSYSVLATRPKKISVRQTAPQRRDLSVIEDGAADFTRPEDLPVGYNAYSPAGTVAGDVVYVNYARPEDFAELKKRGISLEGRIALARYGQNFRGVKPDLAAKAGAVGMIIFSDPADDGFVKGEVYPDGPWRSADAIQRGSVLRIWDYPGDPLTPGAASTPGTPRIAAKDARTIAPIPTTPISYGQARGLIASLSGARVGKDWQGGLDVPYRFGGPGGTKVRLDLDIGHEQVPVHNVVATIPGTDADAGYVLVGGHRDTWGTGVVDNESGWVSTMEIARSLGELYRDGWRPRRTIVLAGWDGEEYGLLGSTEYAENNAAKLREGAIAYLNMDGTAGRRFGAGAVPALDAVIRSVTADVDDPSGEGSVYDAWSTASQGKTEPGRLGSGSDYTGFLQHLGVASADIGFGSAGGQYHSLYDNLDYTQRFADPGFKGVTAAAEVSGSLALRLANADILPMRYSAYAADTITRLEAMRAEVSTPGALDSTLAAAKAWAAATRRLESAGARLAVGGLVSGERPAAAKVNAAIRAQERALTDPAGLPSRPWFKHLVWAPGQTTGYAAQPLPALAEAAQAKDDAAFATAAKALTAALDRATAAAVEGTPR